MRDVDLMARTMRTVRDDGGGSARRRQTGPRNFAWFAGSSVLNGQALSDLIEDGWIRHTPGTDHAIIDAWPRFADRPEADGNAD